VALITDGRFSGLSAGACIGHIGPEALDGGPIGRVRDGDVIDIVIDRQALTGSLCVLGLDGDVESGTALLASRGPHEGLKTNESLPDDTRLWAALQRASGGAWAGCVYDVERILESLRSNERS